MPDAPILVINTGSSSLKFGLYTTADGAETLEIDGLADGIGRDTATISLKDATGKIIRSEQRPIASEGDALDLAAAWIADLHQPPPVAIGHRIVHGGPHLLTHQPLTDAVLDQLRASIHFAPLHLPIALDLIEKSRQAYPGTPQFACFDTAFHRSMPEVATRFALPRELFDQGIRRYGFHGLSYESILHQLGPDLPSRIVIAHLGGGASLAAIRDGVSVDTSMGLTPTGGIPMATRSGDLDPGVLLYLLRTSTPDADSLEHLLNHEAGLSGLSGGESDMRALEKSAAAGDARAGIAIDIFCMQIRKFVAAYAAVLGGLDLLVFAGGIGEHSARVRAGVSQGLAFLGVTLDETANGAHASTLSTPSSRVAVRIVPSQEDLEIARHCRTLLHSPTA